MANLIITIISIALVAVAALMGAYYGGIAFSDGAAKSNATQLMQEAQQIVTAWKLRAVDNGGSYALSDWNPVSGSPDLVPQYLSTFPVVPTAGQCGPGACYGNWGYYYGNSSGKVDRISLGGDGTQNQGAVPANVLAVIVFHPKTD